MVYSIMEVHGVVVETCARAGAPSPDVISGEYIEWIPTAMNRCSARTASRHMSSKKSTKTT